MTSRLILDRRKWLHAVGLLAVAGCAGQTKEEPMWIGHIGPGGKRAESAINGMKQMLTDLSEVTIAGRSIGVRHVEAKDKTRARAEASRLLAVNRVTALIVGPDIEGVGEVIAIARSHGAIVIVLGSSADRTPADQAVWLGTDPESQGELLARYAIAKGQKTYGSKLPVENPVLRGFDREFERKGGKPIRSESLDGNSTVLEVAKSRRPRFVLRGNGPDREVWTLMMNPDPEPRPEDVESSPNLIGGLARGVTADRFPPESRAWVEGYEKRFGTEPNDDAILGADAITLIADGMQTVGENDRVKLAKDLSGRTEIAGMTGPIVRKDGRTIRPMWVERRVKGKRVAIEAVPE